MRKLPIGIQDFAGLRRDGYVYVDKTQHLHRLITTGKVYFLSRPRRFGKSLLVSTLNALFEGKRELFEGLWIASAHDGIEPFDFKPGPVVLLDMNAKEYSRGREYLIEHLTRRLEENAEKLGVRLPSGTPDEQLRAVLRQAHQRSDAPVAVLVDEYDKPLLETLEQAELNREMRSVLKAFYGVLKSADEHLRFTLLTGVTKFSQVSIFSDLNHLRDISRSLEFAELCGITQGELEDSFAPELHALSEALRLPDESLETTKRRVLVEMKEWYDGYLFHEQAAPVYNPFSTLNVLTEKAFSNYWFQTGTPTFLMNLLEKSPVPFESLEGTRLPASAFSEIDPDRLGPIPVLFQAGYLTLREYLPLANSFLIGYPNREVRQSFMEHLVDRFVRLEPAKRGGTLVDLTYAVHEGRLDDFLTQLRVFFANIPHDIQLPREQYYQSIFYLVFRLLGFNVQVEVRHASGRTDAVVETTNRIYLFEFKLDRSSAEDALAQIEQKGYAAPYVGSGKSVVKVGVEFDSELRNIARWVVG